LVDAEGLFVVYKFDMSRVVGERECFEMAAKCWEVDG
jgi:hypothetical protein